MATRFLIKDRKGHSFNIAGVITNHFMVDLMGSPEAGLTQILQLLNTVDAQNDAFTGTCVAEARTAALAGEYPYRGSVSTLTIAWKEYG